MSHSSSLTLIQSPVEFSVSGRWAPTRVLMTLSSNRDHLKEQAFVVHIPFTDFVAVLTQCAWLADLNADSELNLTHRLNSLPVVNSHDWQQLISRVISWESNTSHWMVGHMTDVALALRPCTISSLSAELSLQRLTFFPHSSSEESEDTLPTAGFGRFTRLISPGRWTVVNSSITSVWKQTWKGSTQVGLGSDVHRVAPNTTFHLEFTVP